MTNLLINENIIGNRDIIVFGSLDGIQRTEKSQRTHLVKLYLGYAAIVDGETFSYSFEDEGAIEELAENLLNKAIEEMRYTRIQRIGELSDSLFNLRRVEAEEWDEDWEEEPNDEESSVPPLSTDIY